MGALSQLSPELVAMMVRGVSVHVASRDARLRPSVMRAMASAVDAQACTVTVYLARRQAAQVLADIDAGGGLAVVFSSPSTHRTVQVKATSATSRPATDDDRPVLEDYRRALEVEIGLVGHPPEVVHTMFSSRLDDLVALTLVPEQVFDQTPGPKAGKLVAGAA